jgi:hypothetical protein
MRKDLAGTLAENTAGRFKPFAFAPAVPDLGTLCRGIKAPSWSLSHHTPPPVQRLKCCNDQLNAPPLFAFRDGPFSGRESGTDSFLWISSDRPAWRQPGIQQRD